MIFFWILIIVLVVYMLRNHGSGHSTDSDTKQDSFSALDILKERYAKGEIDAETYEKMKKMIS